MRVRRLFGNLHLTMLRPVALMLISAIACADGSVSGDLRIDSGYLDYALQYRVYVPEAATEGDEYPTIYVTDGQWYLHDGLMVEILDREIELGNIEPVVAVFLDSRNPDDLSENRRNEQFMCNQKYVEFFQNELVPTISANFPVSPKRDERVIAGLSFGGLNAACFGMMASGTFSGIGMQSPASTAHLKVLNSLYSENPRAAVEIFLSVGKKNDNTKAARAFHRTLQKKGYKVTYIEVPFGHSWDNWYPLIDDLLQTFFGTQ